MLDSPKGFEYWDVDEQEKSIIVSNAPDWAKEEFEKYQEQLKASETVDEDGNLKSI
ncbi:hypothetical protein [Enterococcus rotai]|uniref:hypothetical protein n=1 Tax=Enterococcus rotai TaxID=118060 RepID=UPI0035C70A28